MKKNLLIALFATATMAGAAETSYNKVSWNKDSGGTVDTSSAGIAGNWSMNISLNNEYLTTMFQNKPGDHPWMPSDNYNGADTLGQALFTVKGSASQQRGAASARQDYNVSTTFVTGWGCSWYDGLADNGVDKGFHIGVTDRISPNTHNFIYGEAIYDSGYNMSDPLDWRTFEVYRFDTKTAQADGTLGKATLDSVIGGGESALTITAANLVVVHTVGANSSSDTDITLTLSYGDGKTIIYTASINDVSTFGEAVMGDIAGPGHLLGGSAFYDVDNITSIDGINGALVSGMDIYNQAFEVNAKGELVVPGGDTPSSAVPEPTTATLSLLALAGLCARRRRK